MSLTNWFLLLFAACSLYNCGTIWMTQRVSYPLFRLVGSSEFVVYDWHYFLNIIPVVIIPAFCVMIGSLAFLIIHPHSVPEWALLVNAIFGLAGLAVTLGLEIPRNLRLQKGGKSDVVIQELIRYNWLRTLVFTAHALLMVWLLTVAFAPVGM
jgi:hypothetical protein